MQILSCVQYWEDLVLQIWKSVECCTLSRKSSKQSTKFTSFSTEGKLSVEIAYTFRFAFKCSNQCATTNNITFMRQNGCIQKTLKYVLKDKCGVCKWVQKRKQWLIWWIYVHFNVMHLMHLLMCLLQPPGTEHLLEIVSYLSQLKHTLFRLLVIEYLC